MVDFGLKVYNAQGLPVIDFESEPLVCLGRYGVKALEADPGNRILYCFPIGTFTQDVYVNLIDYLPRRLYEITGDFRYLASVVVSPNIGGASVFLFGPLSLAIDLGIGKLGTGQYGLEVYGSQGALTYSDNYITLDVIQTVDLSAVTYESYPIKRIPHANLDWVRLGYCWLSRVKSIYLAPLNYGRTMSKQAPGWYVDRNYTRYQAATIDSVNSNGIGVKHPNSWAQAADIYAYLWKPGARPLYINSSMIGGSRDILALVRLPAVLDQLPVQPVIWQ